MKKKCLIAFFLFSLMFPGILTAQEAIGTAEEKYFDFLALMGLVQRPTLNFRTLSDSRWDINPDINHPWQNQNLGSFQPLPGNFRVRVYGPDMFMSVNTAAPYGHNDGVLWQGRGFNARLRGGARLEWQGPQRHGLEVTFMPHFAFSQNLAFEIMPSHFENEFGYFWGYGPPGSNMGGADAPQRFGDRPFFAWDFGDSEIRYTWRNFTVGFGTQAIWLGPAFLNPILHSNNAPAYPKFDIGLRRQPITLPWLGWYIGDIEARLWTGRLTGSDFFNNDDSNRHTMFHGAAFAYAPSFLPGLTLFVNWVNLVPWELRNLRHFLPFDRSNTGDEDMKASLGFSWAFPQVGFEVFFEIGFDDYTNWIQHPFHATVYTGGLRKAVRIRPERNIYGLIKFEFNWMEMTNDFQLMWPYSFYFHHLMIRGYTNRGQWLGNGVSPGGNSQHLSFTVFYPRGNSTIFISRNNPDNNYLWAKAVNASAIADNLNKRYYRTNKANFNIGVNTNYFFNTNFLISGGIVYNLIINPLFHHHQLPHMSTFHKHNFSFQLGVRFLL